MISRSPSTGRHAQFLVTTEMFLTLLGHKYSPNNFQPKPVQPLKMMISYILNAFIASLKVPLFPLWIPVVPTMELKPNAGSDRAWVWNTLADYADESPKAELLAIRFLNAESEYSFI